MQSKYDILASTQIKDNITAKELKKKVEYFDLSIWQEAKVAQQMGIDFACRKKNLVTGLYKCSKCGCDEVYTQSIQMRSGDEATHNFAKCSKCDAKPWEV
jgi:DNA-directed RNA polymerase subunit M/transcription elongation factor TFIIS